MAEFKKDPNEIGVCWRKDSARGEFLSGTIDGIGSIVMFPVDGKGNPKAPAYRILKSKPREEKDMRHGVQPVTSSDIPF